LITESEKFSSAASAAECAPTGGRRLGERSREVGARGRLKAKSARGDGPAELPADEVGEGLAPDCSGVVGMAKGDGLRAPRPRWAGDGAAGAARGDGPATSTGTRRRSAAASHQASSPFGESRTSVCTPTGLPGGGGCCGGGGRTSTISPSHQSACQRISTACPGAHAKPVSHVGGSRTCSTGTSRSSAASTSRRTRTRPSSGSASTTVASAQPPRVWHSTAQKTSTDVDGGHAPGWRTGGGGGGAGRPSPCSAGCAGAGSTLSGRTTCRTLAAPSTIAGGAEDEAITTCGRSEPAPCSAACAACTLTAAAGKEAAGSGPVWCRRIAPSLATKSDGDPGCSPSLAAGFAFLACCGVLPLGRAACEPAGACCARTEACGEMAPCCGSGDCVATAWAITGLCPLLVGVLCRLEPSAPTGEGCTATASDG